jgi:hypothetical protein
LLILSTVIVSTRSRGLIVQAHDAMHGIWHILSSTGRQLLRKSGQTGGPKNNHKRESENMSRTRPNNFIIASSRRESESVSLPVVDCHSRERDAMLG